MYAPLNSIVNHFRSRFPIFYQRLPSFLQLMRFDKPIGIYLLLWPTLWGLWIAGAGEPSLANIVIFTAGVVLMRAAGCVINDYADRDFDGSVSRTQNRPLATGLIEPKEALYLFFCLIGLAFLLVLLTNVLTILLSFVAVLLASLYPFMKRYTYMPQVVLGAAFAWSIPMAFAAQTNTILPIAWLLYTITVIWTVAYDTLYAMVDREDDIKIGIKSTAILLGDADKMAIGFLQGLVVIGLCLLGGQLSAGGAYYLSVLVVVALFSYQQFLIKDRNKALCFQAFLNNHWVGMSVFLGILTHFW